MAPIVFDLLNLRQNLMHHYQSLGGWTFAFGKSNIYALFLVSTDDAMLFIILFKELYTLIPLPLDKTKLIRVTRWLDYPNILFSI